MAKSKKSKPSFDAPPVASGAKGAAWVYRSDAAPLTPEPAAAAKPKTAKAAKAAPPPVVKAAPAASSAAAVAAVPRAAAKPLTEREKDALLLVERYTKYAAAAGLVPLPLVDMAAITVIQVRMLRAMCELYDMPFSNERARVIVAALLGGVMPTLAGHQILTTIARRVTVVGTLFGMISVSGFAVAATYAVGRVFVLHFESGGTLLDVDLSKAKDQVAAHFKAAPQPA